MHDILFKAIAHHNKQWVEGYYFAVNNIHFILPAGKPLNEIVSVYPETVCEYTGLTDKNGTNVFEGDRAVFHTDHDEESDPYVVYWDEKNCRYSVMDEELGGTDSFDLFFSNHCTVIGNIHDKED